MGSVGRVVGVDVGATLCKVVPLDAPAAGAHFPSTSLDEVHDAVLTHDPRRVGVTGGGAGGLALGPSQPLAGPWHASQLTPSRANASAFLPADASSVWQARHFGAECAAPRPSVPAMRTEVGFDSTSVARA